MTLLFVDVDHFKSINDSYGHGIGDAVLRQIAEQLLSAIRPTDIVGRYGGEEFIIGLPRCSAENAAVIAERIRGDIAGRPFNAGDGVVRLSVSIGISSLGTGSKNLTELIASADAAMYAAKRQGRNCVRTAEKV
jgi:diguanylate cyclase (GGDEF)-like protein